MPDNTEATYQINEADQRMMTMMVGVIQQLQSTQPTTPVTLPNVTATLERDVKWADIKVYPGACDRLDAWFAAFERKLKACKLDMMHWGEKFFE